MRYHGPHGSWSGFFVFSHGSLSLSPSLSLSLFFLGALTLAGCRPARRSLKNRYIVPEIMLNLQNIIKA